MEETLRRAKAATTAGDRATATRLLADIIRDDPQNQEAWVLLTKLVETSEDQLAYLKQLLTLLPNNQTVLKGIAILEERGIKTQETKPNDNSILKQLSDIWNTSLGKFAVLGVGGIAGLVSICFFCVVCNFFIGQGDNSQSLTLQDQSNENEVEVSEIAEDSPPVILPEPTATPEPPTDTPQPTATNTRVVEPTATVTSTPEPIQQPVTVITPIPGSTEPSIEVQLYALEMIDKLDTFSQALTDFGTLLTEPNFNDEEWVSLVAANIVIIQATHEEISKMKPPAEMVQIHKAVVDATADCKVATDYFVSGVDNQNKADIDKAVEFMNSCSTKMENTTDIIYEWADQFE